MATNENRKVTARDAGEIRKVFILAGIKKITELTGVCLEEIMDIPVMVSPDECCWVLNIPTAERQIFVFTLSKEGVDGGLFCATNPSVPGEIRMTILGEDTFRDALDFAHTVFNVQNTKWAA